ncbi:hypothetical protein ACFY15_18030 [Streptomyces sp. NPDC001373]|uniref:hypothetical protein n=1 Tax=Streptomyces sp. NPDC001373 TaxID=3364565 RepID=UPI0036C8DEBB
MTGSVGDLLTGAGQTATVVLRARPRRWTDAASGQSLVAPDHPVPVTAGTGWSVSLVPTGEPGIEPSTSRYYETGGGHRASGPAFDGTQRSCLRLSADAQNLQIAGKVEHVDALYGTTRHVLDGAANTVGLYCATPVTRRTVTGSRTDGSALSSLLTGLATVGLITDSSTPGDGITDQPGEQNLLAWTYDPAMARHVTAQSSAGVAGRVTLVRIRSGPRSRGRTSGSAWRALTGRPRCRTATSGYVTPRVRSGRSRRTSR